MENINTVIRQRKNKTFRIIGTVIFFICFAPYLLVLFCGLNGINFNLQGIKNYYGFPGMLISMIISPSFFGLIPACIIYQVIYTIRSIWFRKKLKRISLIISAVYAAAFIAIGLFSMHYPNPDLEYLFLKTVDPGYEAELTDNFLEMNSSYRKDLAGYVAEKNNIPDNYTFNIQIESINFENYRSGGDYSVLYEKTKYRINNFNVHITELNETAITDTIYEIWDNIYPNIKDNVKDGKLFIYIHDSENRDVSIFMCGETECYKAHADISGISESSELSSLNGKTIKLS